jgi:hypothetical protein
MIFSRSPKEAPDELANRLQREGRIDQLEHELQRYKPDKLGPKDRACFYHLWGITAFRRGDRTTAFQRFQQGLQQCPDSADIRFSLGQEHEARREIDQMFVCFDDCVFPKVSSAHALAAARYAYLWGDATRGTKYLVPIQSSPKAVRQPRPRSAFVVLDVPAAHPQPILQLAAYGFECVSHGDVHVPHASDALGVCESRPPRRPGA